MMDQVVPWTEWVGLIEPHYYNKARGRRPVPIEIGRASCRERV